MGSAAKAGILTLAEEVYRVCEDMSFDGTPYHDDVSNPRILYVRCDMPEQTVDMNSEDFPNLLRKLVSVRCYRVRQGAGDPAYSILFTSLRTKIMADAVIQDLFGDRVFEIINESSPRITGLSLTKPFIGMLDDGWIVDPIKPSYQREEIVPFRLYVYHQTFAKTEQGILTNPL